MPGAVSLDPVTVLGSAAVIGPAPDGVEGSSIDRPAIEDLPVGLRVEDIVKRMPGVTTGGAPGEDKDVRVLGIDKEFTRTTVNGIPLPDGGEKREFNLDRLPSGFVQSVDVYRGRRAEMEADGLAGRVDIKLRQIPMTPQFDLTGTFGGLDRIGNHISLASVLVGGRLNDLLGGQLAAARSRIPGLKTKEKRNAAGNVTERERENKPADATDLFFDFGFFPPGSEVNLRPMFLELDENKTKRKDKLTAAGAFNGAELEDEHKVKRTVGSSLGGKTTLPFWNGAIVDGRVAYYQTTEDKTKTKKVLRANGTEDANKREWEVEDKTDSIAQAEGNIAVPFFALSADHMAKTGFLVRQRLRDRQKDKLVGSTPSVDPKEDYHLREMIYATYLQDEVRIGMLRATPGVRFEWGALDARSGAGAVGNSADFDVLPSLPVEVKLTDTISLNAGVARVLNRPKFDELAPYENDSASDKIVIGNPNLRPAKAWAYDGGIQYRIPYFGLGLGWFYRDVKDVIESVATGEIRDGKTVEQVRNVGDGWVRGVIFSQRIDFGFLDAPVLNGFSVTANQTLADSELQDATGMRRRFKDQPNWFGNVIVDWRNRQWGTAVSVAVNFTGPFVNEDNGDRRSAEAFLDAKLTQRLTEHVSAFVLAQNITNQPRIKLKTNGETETEIAGRMLMVGLRGKF